MNTNVYSNDLYVQHSTGALQFFGQPQAKSSWVVICYWCLFFKNLICKVNVCSHRKPNQHVVGRACVGGDL